jgi:hypothetical protein
VGGGFVIDCEPLTSESVENVLQVDGVEHDHGVGHDGEAERLFAATRSVVAAT